MELITTEELSELIRTPASTLRYWRHKGTGPRSFSVGPKRVMYRKSDVDSWLQDQYDAAQDAVMSAVDCVRACEKSPGHTGACVRSNPRPTDKGGGSVA